MPPPRLRYDGDADFRRHKSLIVMIRFAGQLAPSRRHAFARTSFALTPNCHAVIALRDISAAPSPASPIFDYSAGRRRRDSARFAATLTSRLTGDVMRATLDFAFACAGRRCSRALPCRISMMAAKGRFAAVSPIYRPPRGCAPLALAMIPRLPACRRRGDDARLMI